MSSDHPENVTKQDADPAASRAVWPTRGGYIRFLSAAAGVVATLAAARVNAAFLIVGAVGAAMVADGLDPFHGGGSGFGDPLMCDGCSCSWRVSWLPWLHSAASPSSSRSMCFSAPDQFR